ncbi:MAG: monovalent cation/H(+) antiporter subunit G [Planctomycetota bacterium]|nr:monovalent cation/H(+) antiporter subunit G [Planctomycetota bacterium]
MTWIEACSAVLLIGGSLFFIAGTAGLLRFPDTFTRLHAVTKADNLGLGLLIGGLILQATSWHAALKLLSVWLLVLVASSTACHLVARAALQSGIQPWKKL